MQRKKIVTTFLPNQKVTMKHKDRSTFELSNTTPCHTTEIGAGFAGSQLELFDDKHQWTHPTPFNTTLLPVKEFDEELLPENVRKYVMHYARRMDNTPPDFSAISLLVCAGALVGGNVEIQPKQFDSAWTVVPTFWGAAVGSPSTKKTPSLNCGIGLLRHAQAKVLDHENKSQAAAFELKKEIIDKAIKDIKEQAKLEFENGNDDAGMALLKNMPNIDNQQPVVRDVVINDCTSEALTVRLKSNPSGVLVFRDELTGWLSSLKQPNREHERGFYLEGFNGSKSPYIQERISRERIEINRVVISLLGGIQPQMLMPLLSSRESGVADDGMVERIIQLMVYPDHNKSIYVDEEPSCKEKEVAEKVFEKLAQLNTPKDPLLFKFNKEAQIIWNDWSVMMLDKENSSTPDWQSLYGKYKALCAKIALTLQLINEASTCKKDKFIPNTEIDCIHLNLSIKWIEYLETHARRIISMGKKEKYNIPAYVLLEKLPKLNGSFTRQELSQKSWKGLTTKEERDIAISVLIEHNYIIEIKNPKKMFMINPLAM